MIWADTASEPPKILVPTAYQKRIFNYFHDLAHTGSKACYKLIRNTHYWPNMKKDIQDWCRVCISCQRNKIKRHTISPIKNLPKPTKRFQHIHVDIVGPFYATCNGKNGLFTIIDRLTGWPEAIPIRMKTGNSNSETCARLLISNWMSKFGIPLVITSDRGPQFVSRLWADMNKILGIKSNQTTAFHPQSNGKVERMHRTLKNGIRSRLDGKKNWLQELPWVLLGLRVLPNTDTGISPSMMTLGQQLDIPGQMVLPKEDIQNCTNFSRNIIKSITNSRCK